METIIGIVAPGQLLNETNPRRDEYCFGNNYSNRIYDIGGVPMGILPSDGYVSERILDQFDAFLICGGRKTMPYHLQVVHYAVTTGKPLLGICLGMQSIHCYFRLLDYAEAIGQTLIFDREGNFWDVFQQLRNGADGLIYAVEGHRMEHIRGEEEATKQTVHLTPGSHIHRLVGQDTIRAGSFHNFAICKPSGRLNITGKANDGTVDVIEYGEKVLGVQFHPEIDRELMPIFSILLSK